MHPHRPLMHNDSSRDFLCHTPVLAFDRAFAVRCEENAEMCVIGLCVHVSPCTFSIFFPPSFYLRFLLCYLEPEQRENRTEMEKDVDICGVLSSHFFT